jgi:hypothetical protein
MSTVSQIVARCVRITCFVALALLIVSVLPLTASVSAHTRPVEHAQQIAPNSLGLSSFNAKLNKKGQVVLVWDTGTELTILGFNVWRRVGAGGEWKRLNVEMINASNTGEIVGNLYTMRDTKVKQGKTYFYQLEVVSTQGFSAWSEVVRVKVK